MTHGKEPSTLMAVANSHAGRLKASLQKLLSESNLVPGSASEIVKKPFHWQQNVELYPLQCEAKNDWQRFFDLVDLLAQEGTESLRTQAQTARGYVIAAIDQDAGTSQSTVQSHLTTADDMMRTLLSSVSQRTSGDPNVCMIVPDTNALYALPPLQNWDLGNHRFDVYLVSAVMTEIDKHKNGDHKNRDVVEKAKTITRQLTEYRHRGELRVGVPLISGRSRLLTWHREPRMGAYASWLDATLKDDRILVSALDIGQRHAASPLVVVTGDQNLVTKCEMAGVYCLDPAEFSGRIVR